MKICSFSHLIFQNCQEATAVYIKVTSSKLWDFLFFNVFGAAYWQPNPTEKRCSLQFIEQELRLEGT